MKMNFIHINIEDYLHAIDQAFKDKPKKDIYMYYIMIVSLVFGLSYMLFWDSSFDSFETTRKNVISLDQKINADKSFLQLNPESVIVQLDKEIKNLNLEIVASKENNSYIKSKIEAIPSLIYDERTWGEYLDSISKNAQTYSMKIKHFTNRYAAVDSSFGHILDISVKSTGNYKNTLKFINSLEQSDLVVDIHDFSIKAENSLSSDLNISVWGITY